MKIRIATKKDLRDINEIYNQSIPSRRSTADTEPVNMKERERWFREHKPETYPVMVAETDHGIMGWIAFTPYRPGRKALRHTAEISYYIHTDHQDRGVGSQLMEYAIKIAPQYGFKNLIAILISHNHASIKLLEKFGFSEWGRLPETVNFEEDTYDHLYFGKKI